MKTLGDLISEKSKTEVSLEGLVWETIPYKELLVGDIFRDGTGMIGRVLFPPFDPRNEYEDVQRLKRKYSN